jgi:hypothetical protein
MPVFSLRETFTLRQKCADDGDGLEKNLSHFSVSVADLKFLTLLAAAIGRNFRSENHTRNMTLLLSESNPKFADGWRKNVANFG